MTMLIVAVLAFVLGMSIILMSVELMHRAECRSIDKARADAVAEYARRDANCRAVGDWMAQSYRSAGGIAKNAFPDYAAPAPKVVEYEPWVVQP